MSWSVKLARFRSEKSFLQTSRNCGISTHCIEMVREDTCPREVSKEGVMGTVVKDWGTVPPGPRLREELAHISNATQWMLDPRERRVVREDATIGD
jgi:hypothetical protein